MCVHIWVHVQTWMSMFQILHALDCVAVLHVSIKVLEVLKKLAFTHVMLPYIGLKLWSLWDIIVYIGGS